MPGSSSAACARRPASGSATATSSTSSRARQAPRWPRSATLPNPRMAPRSRRLTNPAPPTPGGSTPVAPVGGHLREDLVQDGDAVARLGLRQDEGRIDAHPREIAHQEEPALERAEEDALGDLARERLLRAAVLHQVHP